jgi:hypothetical protein
MLAASDLKIVRFSPIDPDTINIEVWTPDDRLAAELIWDFNGSKVISFGSEKVEIDAEGFMILVSELSVELDQWAHGLRKPDGAWDPSNPYYTGTEK